MGSAAASGDASQMMGADSLPISAQPSADGMPAEGSDAGSKRRLQGKDEILRKARTTKTTTTQKKTTKKRVVRNPNKKDGSDQPM